MYDLNDRVDLSGTTWTQLFEANAINERGQIRRWGARVDRSAVGPRRQNFAMRATPPIIKRQPSPRHSVAGCGSNPSQP